MFPEDEEDPTQALGSIPPEVLAFVVEQQKKRQAEQDAADAGTLEQFKAMDAADAETNRGNALRHGISNSMDRFLGRPTRPYEAPRVDQNVRAFLAQKAQRKAPSPLEELARLAQASRAMREPAVKPQPPTMAAPDETLRSELKKYGLNPDIFPTVGLAHAALNAAMQAGRSATNQAVAAERTEEAKVKGEERKADAAVKRETAKAVADLDAAVEEADAVIAEVKKNPAAFYATAKIGEYLGDGLVGKVAGRVQSNTRDPKDTATRAVVLQRAYKLKNQLAGAAVSEGERKSIEEFNPSENDTAEQIIAKIEGMKRLAQIMREAKAKRLGADAPAPPAPASAPPAPSRPGDKYLKGK